MAGVKQMFLLINFQGFYLGSVCQRWTFPSTITALIDSCVEIPCTYHPPSTSGTSHTVWYLYNAIRYPEILNTKDSSSAKAEYRDRTSMVPGENSCTLRIDPVGGGDDDEYYPGIAEDKNTNAYDKQSRTVHLRVTDAPKNVSVIVMEEVMEGGDVTLQCKSFSKPEVDDYEWYKGKTKLPDRGQKITVRNVTRNMEPYSCAVRNHLGRGKSAPTEIQPVTCIQSATCSIYNQMSIPDEGSHSRKVILPATIGTICSLLLVLLVFFCWRRRSQMSQTSHESTESPDATYTDLMKNDVGQNYEQIKTAEATYAVLIKSDVGQDYEQLKPGIIRRGHEGAVHQYENIYK